MPINEYNLSKFEEICVRPQFDNDSQFCLNEQLFIKKKKMNHVDITKPKKKQKIEFSHFIDNLITCKEADSNKSIHFNLLSKSVGVEKRRLYDLMNVLCSCGVCVKHETHIYEWKGLHQIEETLQNLKKSIELLSINNQQRTSLFDLPESPPIGLLTTTLISLFLFLGRQTLNLHDIARFFTPDIKKEKQIIRRLYLVTYLLEKIRILKHGSRIGEYEFNYNLKSITKTALDEISATENLPADSIEFQLNHFNDSYINCIQQVRFNTFCDVIEARSKSSMKTIKDYQPSILPQAIAV